MTPNYRIALRDTNIVYDCAAGQSLLRGMEKLGIKGIPVGCRGGGCGVCKARVLAGEYTTGKMSRRHVSIDEEADGYVLACRCRPESDLTLAVVGRMKSAVAVN